MKIKKLLIIGLAATMITIIGGTQQASASTETQTSITDSKTYDKLHSELLDHRKNAPLMIAAHRGQWREYPENSLGSVNEAIEDGTEIVEIDVMLTADGVPVLMHDSTVDRTTNGTGKVSDFTLEEIKELRLKEGLGGKTAKLTDYTVPTLEEAMLAAKDRAIVNLDKGWNIREEMYDVLVETDTVDQGLFKGSPNVEEAAGFMAKDPEILYMHIINNNNADTVDTFPGRQPVAYEIVFNDLKDPQIQPEKVQQIQKNSRVFINVMWYGLAGKYTDEASLRDVNLGWKAVTDLGASILQTDNIEALDYWRDGGNMKFWDAQKGNRTVRVQAEDHLPGGQGVGYYDLDPNRNDPSDADWVDVYDRDGATVVKTNQEGEWAKYEVNIPKSGLYKISGRVSASVAPAGTIRLELDGYFSEEIEVENTTHTRAFELQEWDYRSLEKGTHTFAIHTTSPSFHQLDYIQFDLQK
ncbi:glycerophosphodiester phosphodiesterase family protein [Oceanobacillus rekensis]|uniref:glycerophosphodiester phosphodiesterase family protein n=1 Tax=Oceanobacillus rekensis TaxID=937927 RepID=UPI000B4524BC|nr:glycerophosphodiester phosphodiesterase family protein [Oceanobacillus rekensis]